MGIYLTSIINISERTVILESSFISGVESYLLRVRYMNIDNNRYGNMVGNSLLLSHSHHCLNQYSKPVCIKIE